VAPGFYPRVGGEENLIRSWARQQALAGHEVTVAAPGDGGPNEVDGVRVVRQRSLFRVATAEVTPALPLDLLRIPADIVHAHYPMPWNADWGVLIGRARRRPVVLTYCNDLAGSGRKVGLMRLYNSVLLPLTLRLADRIVTISPGYAETSPHLRPVIARTTVIEPGIDTRHFRPLGLPRDPATVLFVGGLGEHHRYKGLETLLEALVEVRAERPEATLVVAGGGPPDNVFLRLAGELGLRDGVRFLGFVTESELVAWYNRCTVFAMPSLSRVQEGFGLVAVEAMACGAPTVVSDLVGPADAIRDARAGLVVRPGDSRDLARALLELLADEAVRQALAERGRALVEERYSEERSGRATLELYQALLDRRQAPAAGPRPPA
jgi:glycosyltransferase involved in cell wall biosynthesis